MVDKNDIKQTIESVLKHMGIEFESIDDGPVIGQNMPHFIIKTNEYNLLIGENNDHFSAINHIIRRMVMKKADDKGESRFVLSVNNNSDKLIEDLKNKVFFMRERAKSFKTNVDLPPMPSYERMIIHALCEGFNDVETFSEGFGDNRKVVIKYVEAPKNI